jgi:hypothetical protein
LSAASGKTIYVSYLTQDGTATDGSDYTSVNSSLTFSPGETSKSFNVSISNDSLDEDNETILIEFGDITNATAGSTDTAVLTITDNDATPSVTFTSSSQSGAENVGTMTITAELSAVSGRDVTVPFTITGTASQGSGLDYTITSSPITITAGQTTAGPELVDSRLPGGGHAAGILHHQRIVPTLYGLIVLRPRFPVVRETDTTVRDVRRRLFQRQRQTV